MTRRFEGYHQVVNANAGPKEERYSQFRRKWDHCSKDLHLNDVPLHVDIEATNACNLRCSMCERNSMTRSVGNMDYALFTGIIDQCVRFGIYSVKLNLWGESILHRDIFKMIGYARKRGVHTQFNTNATFITKDNAMRLIASGLDRLTISIESIAEGAYEKTRKGGKLGTTLENIENFISVKPLGETPLLTIQFIRMKHNHKDIPAFIEKFKDRVDFVSVTNITSVDGNADILKESMIDYSKLPKVPCSELWLRLSVFWNGDVTVCCQDYNGALTIGNIKENSLKELWHSDKLNKLRESHRRLNFRDTACKDCTANHKL